MERKITEIAARGAIPQRKKVAAYARVSSGKDAMLHSLSAQVSHYSKLIQSNPEWEYAGVYADEALTGTKENRESFQRMLADCRTGKIQLIITKSISRFARNTVTLLETVRELKSLGVDVYFEEQNLHSISPDGELMLTILASYAQEESLSASENQKWRIQKNFTEGMPWNGTLLGYRIEHGQYVAVPEEAKIVRRIFQDYLSGMSRDAIAKKLNKAGIQTRLGNAWQGSSVMRLLQNYSYTGNLLLQTTFRENHITKKTRMNTGELPQYHAANTHEAIISLETFQQVQEEMQRRAKKYAHPRLKTDYPFSGLIVCAGCRKHYRRKTTAGGPVWICGTYNAKGKAYCAAKQIPEAILEQITLEVLDETELAPDLHDKISAIHADKNNTLTYIFPSGETVTKHWKDRSRADSWTEEMKQVARERQLKRMEGR